MYCGGLRRQATPRAVIISAGRTKSRGHNALLADMRSIAASGILNFRARTTFSDCLGSLRPSERSGTELKSAKMKCSGVERAESGESVIGRGRNRADAWREERAQVSAR